MPPFRQRPVTYLFLGTTSALIPALEASKSYLVAQGLAIGLIMVSGAWLVFGSTHRLARGAVFVGATAGLAALAMASQRGLTMNSWQRALPKVFVVQIVVAVAAGLALLAIQRFRRPTESSKPVSLRYPVVEVFGWTVVVALASLLLRNADFLPLFQQWRSIIWLLGCCLAGTIAAALHRPDAGIERIKVVFVVALPFLAGCVIAPGEPDRYDFIQLTVATGYLVAYCLCRSLDEALKHSAEVEKLKVKEETDETLEH